jgi:hypothetical protein
VDPKSKPNPWASKPTFAQLVKGNFLTLDFFVDLKKEASSWHGKEVLYFTSNEINLLAKPFELTLIGKFSFEHPTLMSILKALQQSLNLEGGVYPSALNHRYILIRFEKQEDFIRCYTKDKWIINGRRMMVSRWSPNFNIGKESSCTTIWVNLPNLRVHL